MKNNWPEESEKQTRTNSTDKKWKQNYQKTSLWKICVFRYRKRFLPCLLKSPKGPWAIVNQRKLLLWAVLDATSDCKKWSNKWSRKEADKWVPSMKDTQLIMGPWLHMQGSWSIYRLENPHKSKTHGLLKGSEPTKFISDGESFDILIFSFIIQWKVIQKLKLINCQKWMF